MLLLSAILPNKFCLCLCLCGALWCIAVHCGALWCIVVHCGALWCIVVHCVALWCIVVHCGALWCFVVHCGALWYIVVHCGVLWCRNGRTGRRAIYLHGARVNRQFNFKSAVCGRNAKADRTSTNRLAFAHVSYHLCYKSNSPIEEYNY